MKFVIKSARPIKPMFVRYSVEQYAIEDDGEEEYLIGEYEIALNIDEHVDFDITEGKTNINVNAAAIQQELTSNIAEMQLTAVIANGFLDMEWEAFESEEEENNEQPRESDTE